MAQGELLIPARSKGYAIRSKNGGSLYTTKDGGFATEQEANAAAQEMVNVVGKEFEVIPVIVVVIQGRRGRKAKSEANGQPSVALTEALHSGPVATDAKRTAPASAVGAKS